MTDLHLKRNKIIVDNTTIDPHDYFFPQDNWKLAEIADDFKKNWYRNLPENITSALQFKRLQFGELVEYNVFCFILEVFKSLVLAESILKRTKVKKVILETTFRPYISSIFDLQINYKYFLPLALQIIAKQTNLKISSKVNIPGKLFSFCSRNFYYFRHRIYEQVKKMVLSLKKKTLAKQYLSRGSIMFMARGGQNIILSPIIAELAKTDKYSLSLVGDSFTINNVLISALPVSSEVINLDLIIPSQKKEVNSKKEEVISAWKKLRHSSLFQKTFAFEGIYFWDLVKDWFEYVFTEHFIKSVERIAKCEEILKLYQPKLLVGAADIAEFDKTLILLGRQHGIRSLDIQSGYVSFPKMYGLGAKSADKLAVWGQETKQTYLKCGVKEDRIVITGAPKFDNVIKQQTISKTDKSKILTSFGLDPNKKTILVTTQPEYWILSIHSSGIQHTMASWVIRLLTTTTNTQIIFKTHPAESPSTINYYKYIISKHLKQVIVLTDYPLGQLLDIADIVISTASTTGLETVVHHKPLIILNLTNLPDLVSYAEKKVAIKVTEYREFISAVHKSLTDKKYLSSLELHQDQYCKEALYKLDGKAVKRIIKLINDLCQK